MLISKYVLYVLRALDMVLKEDLHRETHEICLCWTIRRVFSDCGGNL